MWFSLKNAFIFISSQITFFICIACVENKFAPFLFWKKKKIPNYDKYLANLMTELDLLKSNLCMIMRKKKQQQTMEKYFWIANLD